MWWAITRKELTQGSKVTNIKATLTFLYINYINQYTPKDTVGKGYGNLAVNISSTKKSSTSPILRILILRSSALLEYLKLPMPLGVGRL